MIDAICMELDLQTGYLNNDQINTIYFGGGTPSLMNEEHVKRILKKIRLAYNLSSNPEITLEANPDDLVPNELLAFRAAGINRLSIGIQSFLWKSRNEVFHILSL
jgi:oxygen-independent coproporphyrinogen-3 oxidase